MQIQLFLTPLPMARADFEGKTVVVIDVLRSSTSIAAMLAAGAYNSMLLDINPTHAHFAAMKVVDGKLTGEALYPEIMDLWVDRYLSQWEMDFFYITGK